MGLHTLIIGLGRSGRELHFPVLTRARAAEYSRHLFHATPVLACDPFRVADGPWEALRVSSPAMAAEMADPALTVVHLCTPPAVRLELLKELASLGYRKFIVEKPLALDEATIDGIVAARQRWGLDVVVVAPWLVSTLTRRIRELVATGRLGAPREIRLLQSKPRFKRTLAYPHERESAFDIEIPHAIALVLALAGSARVTGAGTSDMSIDGVVVLRMGGAWLTLEHDAGVQTDIRSDLTAMMRERRITVRCDRGTIVGHYPVSAADDAAQLTTTVGDHVTRAVFRSDDLTTVIVQAYERFHTRVAFDFDLGVQAEVVRLLSDAKRLSAEPSAPLRAVPDTPIAQQNAS